MKPLLLLAALLATSTAFAQTTIDQNKALAGNVTPGDAPGFPIRISQPGSYKLTSSLIVPADTNGIEVAAHNVTLDLNGFTISGAITCTGSGAGLVCTGGQGDGVISYAARGTTVRNGTVTGFYRGVVLGANALVEQLRVVHNGTVGLSLTQTNAVVDGGNFSSNGSVGIVSGSIGILMRNLTASGNRWIGIQSFHGSSVQGVIASHNGTYGMQGGHVGASVLADNGTNNLNTSYSMGNNLCSASLC
ncbi:hypothetical protein [Roseateles sp.]|uniref:hypothetical protein n=1 Tax=Roseateles sp. TaxID=1971397 RepID=UPI0039EA6814